jgi:pilus assembly protein CpaE
MPAPPLAAPAGYAPASPPASPPVAAWPAGHVPVTSGVAASAEFEPPPSTFVPTAAAVEAGPWLADPAADAPGRAAAADGAIRIVLVEDVPEVAAHVRAVLRPQGRFKLVHVIQDGRHAVEEIQDLQPDVLLVDSLLQGKVSGRQLVERLRDAGNPLGIVVLTVPDHEPEAALLQRADGAVALPFGTYDLGRAIVEAHEALARRDPRAATRIVSVFSAKGGVGKTTIAFNLAVSLAATGLRTLLMDGNLEFGDLRRLLRAGPDAPSICDLPTDFVRGSDLADTVVRTAAGVDALLAPPRPELAELVTGHDLERVIGVLRHAYQAIVIDTPSSLGGSTLAMLDAADLILDVVTADASTLEVSRMIADTFAEIGYGEGKVRYIVNRADSVGAAPLPQVARAIGREPDYALASDWTLVSASNVEGVPYVLAAPDAAVSLGVRRIADDIRSLAVTPSLPAPVRLRSRIA